jgi:hypothetical protein
MNYSSPSTKPVFVQDSLRVTKWAGKSEIMDKTELGVSDDTNKVCKENFALMTEQNVTM